MSYILFHRKPQLGFCQSSPADARSAVVRAEREQGGTNDPGLNIVQWARGTGRAKQEFIDEIVVCHWPVGLSAGLRHGVKHDIAIGQLGET